MNKTTWYTLWGCMFILCAGLGFIPEPGGLFRWLLTAMALLFFLPPFALLGLAKKEGSRDSLKLLRDLSAASLVASMALIIANLLSFAMSQALGTALYVMLVIVSSPMICSGYWVLSLFLWACLLIGSMSALRDRKAK